MTEKPLGSNGLAHLWKKIVVKIEAVVKESGGQKDASEEVYDFVNSTCTFGSDGSITIVMPEKDLKTITTFSSNTITRTRYKNSTNTLLATEVTTISSNTITKNISK